MPTRRSTSAAIPFLLGSFIAHDARAQESNELQLQLESGGAIGQSLVWSVEGQDPFPGILQALGVDFALVPGGLELAAIGTLHLAFTPAVIILPGDGTGYYALGVPDVPSLQGMNVHAQAVGTPIGAPPETLALSNLVTTTLASTTPVGRFVHALHLGDGSLSTFGLDPGAGAPRALGVVDAGPLPTSLAVSSDGRFVWTVDAALDVLRTFMLEPNTGRLEAGAVVPCDPGTSVIEVDPGGKVLVAASVETDRVRAFRIDLATGTPLTAGIAEPPTVLQPVDIAYDPLGRTIYVLSGEDHTIHSFRVESASGALEPAAVTEVGEGATALALGPKGIRGFVAIGGEGVVEPFGVSPSGGKWISLPAGAQAVGERVGALAVTELEGSVTLYADDPELSRIGTWALDTGTGILSQVAQTPHAGGVTELAIDLGAAHLYTTEVATQELVTYELSGDGTPTESHRVRTRAIPIGLGMARGLLPLEFKTRSLFVAHETSNELRAFQVLGPNAQVSDQAGGVFPTQASPVSVALSPDGAIAVTADFLGAGLTRFLVNITLGQLGSSVHVTVPTPFDIEFEPSGRYAYVSSVGADSIEIFERGPGASLVPVASAPLEEGSFARGVEIDPTGRFLYVACSLRRVVETFGIDLESGLLAHVGTTPVAGDVLDVCSDPTGRFLYAISIGPNTLEGFGTDAITGTLNELPSSSVNLGNGTSPAVVTTEPSGRYLYVANSGDDTVRAFAIDPTTGEASPLPGGLGSFSVPGRPRGLAVSASGAFLFVARQDAGSIDTLAIDPATGGLSSSASTPSLGGGPRGMAASQELE